MAGHPMPTRAAAAHEGPGHKGGWRRPDEGRRRRAGRWWRRDGSAGGQGDDRRDNGKRPKERGHGRKSFRQESEQRASSDPN